MEISINAWLGMGLGLGPVVIFLILISCPPGPFSGWRVYYYALISPLMVVLPLTCNFIQDCTNPRSVFNGIALGVSLYIFGVLLFALVCAIIKPNKIKRKQESIRRKHEYMKRKYEEQ